MDLRKVIQSLRREKEKLDRVIASLEELQGAPLPQKNGAALSNVRRSGHAVSFGCLLERLYLAEDHHRHTVTFKGVIASGAISCLS